MPEIVIIDAHVVIPEILRDIIITMDKGDPIFLRLRKWACKTFGFQYDLQVNVPFHHLSRAVSSTACCNCGNN